MRQGILRKVLLQSSLLVLTVALSGAAPTAQAADLPVYRKAPPAVEVWNPWMIRVRALGVLPDASGSTVNVLGVPALSSPNSGLSISNSVVPELDISYFFTKNIAAELVLGVTKHSVTGTGTLAGLNVGSSWLLPPSLTLQYHFTDIGAFKPYVGVGVNYTVFFSQSPGNTPLNGLAVTQLGISNSFGAVAQVGFDYMIDRHWGLNVDVKKLYLEPSYSATVNNAIPVSGRANINPWLVAGGVTYKF
jgi:outer membrane protein